MTRQTVPALPRLAAFCRANLHEDFLQDHPSAAAAVQAWAGTAGPREADRLAAELRAFGTLVAERTLAEVRALLAGEFGAAWAPRRRADLDAFVSALDARPGGPRRGRP